jgi:hypothetical protein
MVSTLEKKLKLFFENFFPKKFAHFEKFGKSGKMELVFHRKSYSLINTR